MAQLPKNNKITVTEFIRLFDSFSETERNLIAKIIYESTFSVEWRKLNKDLPNMSLENIMQEVKEFYITKSGTKSKISLSKNSQE